MLEETQRQLDLVRKQLEESKEPLGDGGAIFLEEGTEDEFEEYVHLEEKGWGGFIKKVFSINDTKRLIDHEDDKTSDK